MPLDKTSWLRLWGYKEGTAEAEAAWAAKLAFRPQRSKVAVFTGIDYTYDCPITGKHITSKHQHQENLKQHGCRILETGEREFNERRRAEADALIEAKVDQTIEKAIDEMPSEKREQLAHELINGVSAEVTRS